MMWNISVTVGYMQWVVSVFGRPLASAHQQLLYNSLTTSIYSNTARPVCHAQMHVLWTTVVQYHLSVKCRSM